MDPEDTVEPHLNLNQGDYGYSHENCLLSSTEVVARDKLGCSYILINSTNGRRCSPGDSTFLASLPSAMIMEDECPAEDEAAAELPPPPDEVDVELEAPCGGEGGPGYWWGK